MQHPIVPTAKKLGHKKKSSLLPSLNLTPSSKANCTVNKLAKLCVCGIMDAAKKSNGGFVKKEKKLRGRANTQRRAIECTVQSTVKTEMELR